MGTSTPAVSSGVNVAGILKPAFQGIPDGATAAKYLIDTMIAISKYNLPIKIYITKDVAEYIGNLLTALNIRFRSVHASGMQYPCIFISVEGGNFVISTYDENGTLLESFKIPVHKLIEELRAIVLKKKSRKTTPQVKDEELLEITLTKDIQELLSKFEDEKTGERK